MWYVRDVLYAVLYVRVSCFVVRGCVGRVSVFWLRWCGWFRWGVGRGLGPGSGGVVLCMCESGLSVYCAWRIPAHLRCSQCPVGYLLPDKCFVVWA